MKKHTTLEVLLLIGLCFSGAAALIYEVAWTRALSLVMGSTTYALSTMLASFMTGLTVGGYLGGLWADRTKNPAFVFGLLEAGIAVFGVLTFIIIKNLSPVYAWVFYTFHLSFSSFSFAQLILSFLVMLIPTTLMGATFPMVLRARTKDIGEIGRETGDVYSINSLGAVAGSIGAGFFLIPLAGVTITNIVAAGLNLVVAIIILYISSSRTSDKLWGIGLIWAGILFALVSLYASYPSYIYNYYSAKRFPSYDVFQKQSKAQELLFEKEGVQGLVQVFMDTKDNSLNLVNNGKIEGSAARRGVGIDGGMAADWANQLLLAYLPLEARQGMNNFLNIGLGTGTTLRAAMSDMGLMEIDCVEINPDVLDAVRRHFYPELFEDARITFIVADARNYLALVPKRYDVISSEPSYPVDQGISNLFSFEFFGLVKSRLTERGVFAQWLPGYLLSDEDKKMMIKTFGAVFPYTYGWDVAVSHDIILVGSNAPLSDTKDIFERVEKREKAQGIWRNYRLWFKPEDVRKAAAEEGLVNTDDRPLIEFAAARNMLR
ncbi:MAG: fused MFS/spermidine synthase [Candidatus Omnitrophica bacterium]|nr:fused MFS/spermidine synthase [Candidatus Omnitrophota bacterium]